MEKQKAQKKEVTRRNFLKLVGTLGVVGATATLAGCSNEPAGGGGWLPQQYQVASSWPAQVRGRVPLNPLSAALSRDDQKCILCGQCVEVCQNVQSVFGYYELPIQNEVICVSCGQCALWCPTAAITEKDELQKVIDALEDPNKFVVVQTAPATRVALGEEFGLPAGSWVQGQQVAALKQLGFDKVFDTNFTADLTILEEGTELIGRITGKDTEHPLPQFTSCSPGWIQFCEYYYPDLIPNLSTCKSPQQMFGTLVKTYYAEKNNIDPKNIVSVSIMPCTAKKHEAARPEMNDAGEYWNSDEEIRDVDVVLTTRELARLIKRYGIDLPSLAEENYDEMMGEGSGAGLIFGATGGVMEAAVRTAYFVLTNQPAPELLFQLTPVRGLEGVKEASLEIPGTGTLNIAVVHGLGNARTVLEAVRRGESPYHFIEFMCCPGGCISGGGQPRTSLPPSDEVREARIASIYNKDASYELRESHENQEVVSLYETFLDHPVSPLAYKLLHTKYTDRGNLLVAKNLEKLS